MTWTCQRVSGGVKCGHRNTSRKRKCVACGKPRPSRRRPAHLAALEADYERFIVLNGGEHCGICGRAPSGRRRLDRDHDHRGGGAPRGLLCARCNRALPSWITVEWLQAAITYLGRLDVAEQPADQQHDDDQREYQNHQSFERIHGRGVPV